MNMKKISLILTASLCFACLSAKSEDTLTMDKFAYAHKLMIAGYTGTETLQNFPVLVRLDNIDGFKYSNMSDPTLGRDLAFFDANGEHLASEIDTWRDDKSKKSLVWVKLPEITQGTKFFVCYNPSASGVMVTNANPWTDYVGVWHLGESGNAGTAISDSTTNHLDGTAAADNTEGVNGNNGAIGRARRIAKNNFHAPGIIIDATNGVKNAVADSLGTDFHASFWMRAQGKVSYSYLLGRRRGDNGASWGVQFYDSDPPSKVRIFSGGVLGQNSDNDCVLTDAGVGTTLSEKTSNPRTWKKVDVIWKDATNGGTPAYDFYINGAFVESKNLKMAVNTNEHANIGIGCSTQDVYANADSGAVEKKGRRLNGDMDEVRLRPGIVSADWIKADYDTVNNEQFVTEAQPEVTWVNSSGTSPGVSFVHYDYVAFDGTVTDCGGFPNCSIQCKVWATGGVEPESWTTLTNGLVVANSFSVVKSGLAPGAAYSYKLRATGGGEDDAGSEPVSGSFTTLAGFAVAWSTATEATGLSLIHHDCVVVAGEVTTLITAESFEVQWKCWADGAAEPESWTTITNVLGAAAFEVTAGELASGSTYNYALRAVANDGETTTPVVGTFTTLPGLTVEWDETAGIVQVGYNFAKIGGTVVGLGEATSCIVQQKIWAAGESEPDWETFKTGLVRNNSFTDVVSGLMAGTTYSYKLRAYGDDGETTEVVEGTFTTLGEEGETIGSDYTHFFSDGTNSFWVADGFERYLPFTVTGYTGTETLTNFPVLVDVRKADTNGFSYDDFYHYDGSDIAFVDEKGHIIPHEIDTWNKNGMSLFWVRLPEMNDGTTFTMCYRSPLLETPPDPGNTFEPYVGVWHMNERKDGVVNLKDSSVNNFETETHAMSLADNNGRVGYARRVAQSPGSSSSFGRIIAFDHDDILRTSVGNVFTFSGWYKLAATPPKWAYLVSRKSEDADKGWGIQYDEKDTTTELRVWSGSSEKNKFQIFKISGMSSTGWNYWTFIYDGSVNQDGTTNQLFHAYLNGEELSTTAGGFHLNYPVVNDENATFEHLVIGGQQNGTGAFNGLVDEARYSKGMRSSDWILAEYNSMLQVNTPFVTKGTVSRGTDSLVPVVVWERGAGLPDTILDVSYAYVQFAGTVTYCGAGAEECRIEYQIWADGESRPEGWTLLRAAPFRAGDAFSIPVTGLKQDMLYNFRIRAANESRQGHEHAGQFRTNGNLELGEVEGDLFRVGDKFVHRFSAGAWTFTTPDYVTNVEIMVVGGGGAGGYKVGGGGGGGGVFHSLSFPVATSTVYRINVGAGGTAATDVQTHSASCNGESSFFALDTDAGNPLIIVSGGGGGGSYTNNADIAKGAVGASGGGGTYAFLGGEAESNEVDGVWQMFGHKGGRGNDSLKSGSVGKVAAGGGGGAGRAGLGATFDQWSAGGAGGVGVGCAISGETLFYGAGGGGGYIYRTAVAADGTDNFTKPGGGGSGIGGNAADVRNGTPATSGFPNTGAGGGGGSSLGQGDGSKVDETDSTYWQGGNGGDGVVLIAYEAHGRDPISEEPQISMIKCDYISKDKVANINYRAFWAGIQAQENDVFVLYSTVSEADVVAGNGELVKVATDTIGIGATTFTPPAVGYTYWIRLVARKDANSFMYSDEVATFFVPAVEVNGTEPKMPDQNGASNDYAIVSYNLFDTASDARLYCYWSENMADIEGDAAPTGSSVHFLDLGTGCAGEARSFTIKAEDGLERNKTYYVRLATGNEAGTKYFLSRQIVLLEMIDKPRVIFDEGVWANHTATVDFLLTTAYLDPSDVDLIALYSGDEDLVKADPVKTNLVSREGVVVVNLGMCSRYPDDTETTTQFPMWSPVNTNFYVRLALATNGVPICYSQRYHSLTAITAVSKDTLLVYVNADAKIGCYGDAQQELTYEMSYGGRTEGPGWDHWLSVFSGQLEGELATEAGPSAPAGQHGITQGTMTLGSAGQTYTQNEPVIDPETGNPVTDPSTGDPVLEPVPYYYQLIFTGSKYTVTNAQFTVSIEDASTIYTGEDFNVENLNTTVTGLRNNQPITYLYRVGTNDWSSSITTTYSEIWTHIIQFKASAPNHDDARGTFMITINPAPLSATISADDLNYVGVPQVPSVTTNVTGHIRPDLNPLTCEFRDEAGEWITNAVPSFTQPGTYKLFFRVSAPNHTSYTTNCTFRVIGWDYKVNMDGASDYDTSIRVTDPGWFLRNTEYTSEQFAVPADRYAYLDAVCANGLKLWQNYIIERTDFSKKLVAAIHQNCPRVTENCFELRFPDVVALRNTGLDVRYRVDRKLKDESEFTQGALTDKYEVNVPLGPHDPTGLYIFNMVLVSTNEVGTAGAGEAVLASCATVGVMRVSCTNVNTVTAVPWMSMTKDSVTNEDVAVVDAVNPNGISVKDMILSYNASSGNFNAWSHAGGGIWDGIATVSTNGIEIVSTNNATFARGNAFWLVRSNPGDYFYLIGRYTGDEYEVDLEGGTAENPGNTLVANPTTEDIALNDLVFVGSVAPGDKIMIQNAAGAQTIYYRGESNSKWGCNVLKKEGRRMKNVWTPGGTVPSGTGFWYLRTSESPLSIRFNNSFGRAE